MQAALMCLLALLMARLLTFSAMPAHERTKTASHGTIG
jgi:hypothetical protein